MVVVGCVLFVSSVVLLCVFVFVFVFFLSLLCPFLSCMATMSFAGYFLVRCLLSAFRAFLRTCSQDGLIWFGSFYLVTTAGFVADQLM